MRFVARNGARVHLISGSLKQVSTYVDGLTTGATEAVAVYTRSKSVQEASTQKVLKEIAAPDLTEVTDATWAYLRTRYRVATGNTIDVQVSGHYVSIIEQPTLQAYTFNTQHDAANWIKRQIGEAGGSCGACPAATQEEPVAVPVPVPGPGPEPTPSTLPYSVATTDVINERQRQITVEQYNAAHDERYTLELRDAAVCYVESAKRHKTERGQAELKELPHSWPWPAKFWKPKSERQDLVRAAALLIADIDRLDRDERINSTQAQLEAAEDPRPC